MHPHVLVAGTIRFLLASLVVIAGCARATRTAPAPSVPATALSSAQISVSATSPLKDFGTMWTFDAPPLEYWRARYQFDATPQWLEHVRMSAIRLPNCSASVVSANGLVLTNHHCARECVTAASPPDSNYNQIGFVARAAPNEKRCPGVTADRLQSIEDVTGRVAAAATASDPAEQQRQRSAAIATLQSECTASTGLLCQVVSLYQGGRYSLYRFKRYDDVRLVFAPEEDVAFFGGDPDNFTYPRYCLDVSLLRIYENGAPLRPPAYLKWSTTGATDGDVAFVVGNPGSTGRLLTMAQLEYLRDVQYPNTLDQLRRQGAALRSLAARSEAARRRYEDAMFSIENSIKAFTGYRSGLLDSTLMARKAAFERDFRNRIEANAETRGRYGAAWPAIETANRERASFSREARFHGPAGSQLLGLVLQIARLASEGARPDSLRLPQFRGSGLEAVRGAALREVQFDPAQEEALLTSQWEAALETLGRNDPFVRAAIGGRSPADATRALFAGTRMVDVSARRALVDGGAAAVAASSDPMVVLARAIEPLNRAVALRTAGLQATLTSNAERIGQAIFAAYGTMLPPDATFTLRISDGVVKGYPMNGTIAPYRTSYYGLYARAAEFDNKAPFALPRRWIENRDKLDLTTPYNFVSTNDIIGGNSGSPVVNRAGEIIGLIFDSNIEGLPNNFLFSDERARAVSVHSRAIVAALRAMFDAGRIADELEGR